MKAATWNTFSLFGSGLISWAVHIRVGSPPQLTLSENYHTDTPTDVFPGRPKSKEAKSGD